MVREHPSMRRLVAGAKAKVPCPKLQVRPDQTSSLVSTDAKKTEDPAQTRGPRTVVDAVDMGNPAGVGEDPRLPGRTNPSLIRPSRTGWIRSSASACPSSARRSAEAASSKQRATIKAQPSLKVILPTAGSSRAPSAARNQNRLGPEATVPPEAPVSPLAPAAPLVEGRSLRRR